MHHCTVFSNFASVWFFFFFFNRSISRGGQVWAPEGSTAFKCLLSARFCAALLSNISDCDETFNYWEPVSTTRYHQKTWSAIWHSNLLIVSASYCFSLTVHVRNCCDDRFDRCTTCCTAQGCRHGSILHCTPSGHTLTYGYTLFLLVCMHMFYRQTR